MAGLPKLAIFCGAGSSAPMYPVMAQFATSVQKSPDIETSTKVAFSRIQAELGDMAVLVGADPRNIEHIMSLIDTVCLTRPNYKISSIDNTMSIHECANVIRECIAAIYSPRRLKPKGTLEVLLDKTTEHADCSVVTTNYDLNIELSASSLGIGIRTPPSVIDNTTSRTDPHQPAANSLYHGGLRTIALNSKVSIESFKRWINLSKLHGSVNWTRNGTKTLVEDRIHGVYDPADRRHIVPYLGSMDNYDSNQSDCRLISDTSVIVAPSVLKPHVNNDPLLTQQWEMAGSILNDAELLWIIGYSFPQSDSFMKYFFASCLHHNTNLRRIVIIDPNANDIVDRVPDLFASSTFGPLVSTVPFKIQDIDHPIAWEILNDTWSPSVHHPIITNLRNQMEAKQVMRGKLPPSHL